ncbi:hypothetical protein [Burkholderia vietnamiensis]|uniref:hypothetical protein n=1 Tax=Burkholderia vietnamiensis TaxID=60552 RepID=UPI001588CA5D|nr:hypothetical protein [Burkholderia vietnamiensis]MCA8145458.1 hypothetical protein [Burkholderia vietnamiensis]
MSDEYAFPVTDFDLNGNRQTSQSKGMALRDYFAAAALGSVLMRTPPDFQAPDGETPQEAVARHAYAIADAMMKVRDE